MMSSNSDAVTFKIPDYIIIIELSKVKMMILSLFECEHCQM